MIMDGTAFDFITSSKLQNVQNLARQLSDFYEAGFVTLRNLTEYSDEDTNLLKAEADAALTLNREFWMGELRKTILWWEAEYKNYRKAYWGGKIDRSAIPWSISAALSKMDLPPTSRNIALVRGAIFTDVTEDEHLIADIAMLELLNYTNCNRLHSIACDASVYDWTDMYGFMTAVDRLSQAYSKKTISAANFIVHEMARMDPGSLSNAKIINILSDRRIRDFRRYALEARNRDPSFLREQKEKVYSVLLDNHVKIRRRDMFKIITRFVKASLVGNLTFVEIALHSMGMTDILVKSTDEFIKSVIMEAEMESNGDSPEDALKALYSLKHHI